jgi:hypothetical protein
VLRILAISAAICDSHKFCHSLLRNRCRKILAWLDPEQSTTTAGSSNALSRLQILGVHPELAQRIPAQMLITCIPGGSRIYTDNDIDIDIALDFSSRCVVLT